MTGKTSVSRLNESSRDEFVGICGRLFEHSPWIAERTWSKRPFASLDALHAALVSTVASASPLEQVALIKAHPDLVGRLAREGRLTKESSAEQCMAGLASLTADEIAAFDAYNSQYREKFDFPFVICARENKKDAILAAFPVRLKHSREQEIGAALTEIGRITRLRLLDIVLED